MTDIIESTVRSAVKDYKDEASRRREISKVDPVADAIDYIAGDLVQRIENARIADGEWLTAKEYGAQPDVHRTEQTIRAWIRAGQLPAKMTPNGYLVRKGEQRVIRRKRA